MPQRRPASRPASRACWCWHRSTRRSALLRRTAGGRRCGRPSDTEERIRDKGSRDARPNEEEPRMAEAYCVKDNRKVEVQNPQRITMKNGKPAPQGTCPICGNKVFRIGGRHRHQHHTRKDGPRREVGAVPCPDRYWPTDTDT